MEKIKQIIQKNKAEALNIISKHGGRIDFIEIDKNEHHGNEYPASVKEFYTKPTPYVITTAFEGEIQQANVLAVRASESNKEEIEFLCFADDGETDWVQASKCLGFSEQEVYEYIGTKY